MLSKFTFCQIGSLPSKVLYHIRANQSRQSLKRQPGLPCWRTTSTLRSATTPCPVCRANYPTDSAMLRQMGRPSGCYLLSIGSRCSNSIEKSKTEKATRCVTFSVLAPPVGLEPTTPCNNPTDSALLRQLRKFALSASSEGQTLRSAALRAAAC